MKKRSLALVVSLAMSACTSSRQPPASPVELKHFSLDSNVFDTENAARMSLNVIRNDSHYPIRIH